jgi:hypothetical protein
MIELPFAARRPDTDKHERRGATVKKCQNCQFYDRKDGRSTDGRTTMWGQCRRHSPQLSPHIPQSTKSYVVEGIWPVVRDDDWCGEWFAPAPSALPRTHGAINGQELMAASVSASENGSRSPVELRPLTAVAGDD